MKRSGAILLWTLLVACGDDQGACEKERAFLAAHRACAADADCVIVGSCSGGFGFSAVNVSAREQAQALSDNTSCGPNFDGPLYSAVCRAGECTGQATGRYCGQPALEASVP